MTSCGAIDKYKYTHGDTCMFNYTYVETLKLSINSMERPEEIMYFNVINIRNVKRWRLSIIDTNNKPAA